jgi:hypothetical protein
MQKNNKVSFIFCRYKLYRFIKGIIMRIPTNNLALLIKSVITRAGASVSATNQGAQSSSQNQTPINQQQSPFMPIALGIQHPNAPETSPHFQPTAIQPTLISPEQTTNTLYDNGLLHHVEVNDATYSVRFRNNGSNNPTNQPDESHFKQQVCKELYSQARMASIVSNDLDLSAFAASDLLSIRETAEKSISEDGIYSLQNTSQRLFDDCLDFASHNPDHYRSVLETFHLGLLEAENLVVGVFPQLSYDTYKTTVHRFITWAKTVEATSSYV